MEKTYRYILYNEDEKLSEMSIALTWQKLSEIMRFWEYCYKLGVIYDRYGFKKYLVKIVEFDMVAE